MIRLFSMLLLITGILACNKKVASQQPAALNESENCKWNESKTFQLCVSKEESSKGPNLISFTVYDVDGTLVYSNSISSGYVRWLDNNAVEYFQTPGIMPTTMTKEDFVKVYLIDENLSVYKKEYKNQ